MFHGTVGLTQVGAFLESFFLSFPVSLVAVAAKSTTLTAATRACGLLAASRLARAAFSLSHDSPRSLRNLAQ
jgi:hypothetical protein